MRSFPPGLVVEHSELWAYIPADGDEVSSAMSAATSLLRGRLGYAVIAAGPVTQWWMPLVRPAVEAGCTGVFLLLPDGLDSPPAAAVRLDRFEGDPSAPPPQLFDDVLRGQLLPDRLQVTPPRVEPLPGTGGERLRVRQRTHGGRRGEVLDHALWMVHVAGAVWALSTTFEDPAEAERWVPEIDVLAGSLCARWPVAEEGVLVLRPESPEPAAGGGILVRNIPHSSLTIDRERGEVTWLDDSQRQARVELRLGNGPGEVAGLLRATFPPAKVGFPQPGDVFRLMLVDREGHVLARSAAWPASWLDQMWPVELLEVGGLPVQTRRFRNTRLLNEAHPGAAPLWIFTGGLWLLMLWALVGAALLLVVGGLLAGNPIWSDWSGFFGR